jgi:hypothetical protein
MMNNGRWCFWFGTSSRVMIRRSHKQTLLFLVEAGSSTRIENGSIISNSKLSWLFIIPVKIFNNLFFRISRRCAFFFFFLTIKWAEVETTSYFCFVLLHSACFYQSEHVDSYFFHIFQRTKIKYDSFFSLQTPLFNVDRNESTAIGSLHI